MLSLDRFETVLNEFADSSQWTDICNLVALIAVEIESKVFLRGGAVTAYEESLSILGELGFVLDISDAQDERLFRGQLIEVISGARLEVSNFRRRSVFLARWWRRFKFGCGRLYRYGFRGLRKLSEEERIRRLARVLEEYFVPPVQE